MKETLAMWWAKILIPIVFTTIGGIVAYFYQHEARTDRIEQDLVLLKADININKQATERFLRTLEELVKGVNTNNANIMALKVKTDSVIERNNMMIEALIKKSERP